MTGIRTARSQAELIGRHTVGRNGPFSALRQENPNRDHHLNGLTLRNSLHLAILAFGVAFALIGSVFGAFSLAALS